MVKNFVTVAVLLAIPSLGALVKPASCSAAIVEMSVSGRVVVIDPLMLLPPEIRTGEPWSGSIRWATDIADSDPDSKHGYYFDDTRPTALSITVNVHGHVFAGGFGELSAHVYNDWPPMPGEPIQFAPGDSFIFGGSMRQSPSLLDLSGIGFSWNDSRGRALAGDELPLAFDPFLFTQNDGSVVVPSYSPIHIKIFDIGLATPTHVIQYDVFAAIETAEFRVVPEPSSVAIGAGCVFIGALLYVLHRFGYSFARKQLAFFCMALMVVFTPWADAAWAGEPRYTITLLDTLPIPPGEDRFAYQSGATAINNQGVVVGFSTIPPAFGAIGHYRAVMWNQAGEPQELWSDRTFGGIPAAINSAGVVVGRYGSATVVPLPSGGIPDGGAFIWNPTSRQFMDLGDLGGSRVEATGINDSGQVSGSSEALVFIAGPDGQLIPEIHDRAFIWDAENGMRDLGTLGGNFSRGMAINSSGQVVGWSVTSDGLEQAFIWDTAGGMRPLGTVEASRAFGINDRGQVVGLESGVGGFLWDPLLGVRRLGNIFPEINNIGQIVGTAGEDALVWNVDRDFQNLQELIEPDSNWDLNAAGAINDQGQIVGAGRYRGEGRGFLLTPIPEPGAFALSIVGAITLIALWRIRHATSLTGRGSVPIRSFRQHEREYHESLLSTTAQQLEACFLLQHASNAPALSVRDA